MYDLIIVGGGPAGSSAGRRAGQLNLDTLLIEKQNFPRYKPCGGAFSEQAMSYLDFKVPDYIHERNIYGARVHYKEAVIEQHKKYRIATLTTRSILDNYLLNKAKETGIEVRYGEKVVDIFEKSNHIEIITSIRTYKSKFVIIAEGSKGKLKHLVRTKDSKDSLAVAVVTEIPADNSKIDSYIYEAIDIHFGHSYLGYGWIFPHEKYFSVGIGGLSKYLPKPQEEMKKFLTMNGFTSDYELKTHIVPVGGITRKIFSRRIVLCGDAAGFVDSFYGEGIAYAIRSGQIASNTISNVLKSNLDLKRIRDYEYKCQKEFGNNLRYSLMFAKLMHKFPKIFFKIFTNDETVISNYLEIPADKKTYKQYLRWLIPRVPKLLLKSENTNN